MNPFGDETHLFGPLFADPEISACFSTDRIVAHFLAFERALALSLADSGAADPADVADAVATIDGFVPDIAAIRQHVQTDGVPVPEFVRQLKAAAAGRRTAALHSGATSQDLIDTSTVLSLREANRVLSARVSAVVAELDRLTAAFGEGDMMARTRMQAALPIKVADRICTWRDPLQSQIDLLTEIAPRLEALQFGGAVGNRSGSGGKGDLIAAAMARHLDLQNPPRAWHVTRAGMAEYAGWLSLVTGTLGKFGQDICLMAQQGVDEVRLSGGGTSSAMPHKQNPVRAELLVTFARYNATQISGMHQALVHEQERSGTAWTLEWLILPAMVTVTGKALLTASDLAGQIAQLGTA